MEEKYADLFEHYEAALRRCNALDFDDLILRTVHLLEQHERDAQEVRRRASATCWWTSSRTPIPCS